MTSSDVSADTAREASGRAAVAMRFEVAPGSMQDMMLIVDDIVAARDELISRGADVSEIFHGRRNAAPEDRQLGPDPDRSSYGTYATFTDPDGNGWLLQQITERLPGRE
jgi:hypothetical protein